MLLLLISNVYILFSVLHIIIFFMLGTEPHTFNPITWMAEAED